MLLTRQCINCFLLVEHFIIEKTFHPPLNKEHYSFQGKSWFGDGFSFFRRIHIIFIGHDYRKPTFHPPRKRSVASLYFNDEHEATLWLKQSEDKGPFSMFGHFSELIKVIIATPVLNYFDNTCVLYLTKLNIDSMSSPRSSEILERDFSIKTIYGMSGHLML